MLFSEAFYTDKQKKYQVWCIERPLSFECSAPLNSSHTEFRISSVEDAVELLFTGNSQLASNYRVFLCLPLFVVLLDSRSLGMGKLRTQILKLVYIFERRILWGETILGHWWDSEL